MVTASIQEEALLRTISDDSRVSKVDIIPILEIFTSTSLPTRNAESAPVELKKVDHGIIAALNDDGRIPNHELSARLGVDPTTVARRRKRLLEEKIIYYDLDASSALLGSPVDLMLWLKVRPGHIRSLGQRLAEHPMCLFVAATGGTYQLVCNVNVATSAAALAFIDEYLSE
ncbi:Lrp/AsnC family transcriptional regulator [Corynebacterium epidermidicanis]|nr:Lrp/AsnC family transcriptional regulator [Corynebacterium epidermidicanis]